MYISRISLVLSKFTFFVLNSSIIYLPGLNGIRAIAASIVLFVHIDISSKYMNIEGLGLLDRNMGGLAVTLFFVLSGYLITYLLLIEKREFRTISYKKFYLRRILRIWPLYYLIIFLTIIIHSLPYDIIFATREYYRTLFLHFIQLTNLSATLNYSITTIGVLWSIGVEEQFYAFWPFLLNKSKNVLLSLLTIIILYLFFKFACKYLLLLGWYQLALFSRFDCLAIGGIAAYFIFVKHEILNIIYHPIAQIIAWLLFFFSLYKPLVINTLISHEFYAIIYAIMILNVSTNPKSLINLENQIFNFIGKISYGIYVYHMLIICLTAFFLKDFFQSINNTFIQYFSVYFTVVFGTLFISFLSYRYFETPFLRLKTRYTNIPSTDAN